MSPAAWHRLNRWTAPLLVRLTGRTLYDRAIDRAQAESLR